MIDWNWLTNDWLLPTGLGGGAMYIAIYMAGYIHRMVEERARRRNRGIR